MNRNIALSHSHKKSGSNSSSPKSSNADGSTEEAFAFELTEVALVEYKGLYYDAKVRKRQKEAGELYYYIHYVGWSKKRDEWVWKDRIVKKTDENQRMANELHLQANVGEKQKPLKRKLKKSSSKEDGKRQASSTTPIDTLNEVVIKKEEKESRDSKQKEDHIPQLPSDRELYLQFPDRLADVLVGDFESETEHKLQPCEIPVFCPANTIFEDYLKYQEAQHFGNDAMDLIGALKSDFNELLPTQLLYTSEFEDLDNYRSDHPEVEFSSILGGRHLLRLFTVVGQRLVDQFPPEDFQTIVKELQKFLGFLNQNFKKYFLQDAGTPRGSPLIGSEAEDSCPALYFSFAKSED